MFLENILPVSFTTAPIVAKSDNYYSGPTTNNKTFTEWQPPKYGRYAITLTGSAYDVNGREYKRRRDIQVLDRQAHDNGHSYVSGTVVSGRV